MDTKQTDKPIVDGADVLKADVHTEFIDDFDGFEPISDSDLKKVMGGLSSYQIIDDHLSM